MLRFLKIWHFTIAGHVISALLFVVVFGFALDGQVSGVPGIPYAQFILPGLAAQAMLNVGYINGTTSLFEARHYRYVNDVLASPLRWWEVNAALVAGGIVREALTAAGVFAVGVPLTGIAVRQPAILIAALVAVLVIGAQLGVLVGSYARSLDQVYAIETLVVLPLGFLGGIFYAVSRLPGPWRLASELDPAFYVVQSLRIGFLPAIFRGVSTRDQPDGPGRRRYCDPALCAAPLSHCGGSRHAAACPKAHERIGAVIEGVDITAMTRQSRCVDHAGTFSRPATTACRLPAPE